MRAGRDGVLDGVAHGRQAQSFCCQFLQRPRTFSQTLFARRQRLLLAPPDQTLGARQEPPEFLEDPSSLPPLRQSRGTCEGIVGAKKSTPCRLPILRTTPPSVVPATFLPLTKSTSQGKVRRSRRARAVLPFLGRSDGADRREDDAWPHRCDGGSLPRWAATASRLGAADID